MSASRTLTSRARKVLAAAGSAAVLALGVPLATATPAAAASCFGVGCAGADPQASGCASDGQTIDARDFRPDGTDLVLQLRYSPNCKTFWTRAVGGTGLSADYGNYHYAQIRGNTTQSGASLYYRYAVDIERATTTWTKMIPSDYWSNACLVWPNPTSDPQSAWNCTPRRQK